MSLLRWSIWCASLTVSVFVASNCAAMSLSVKQDTLILSGEIERRDLDRIKAALAQNEIRTVVLRNSMGGNSWTGYRLGELFREKRLTTVVSGHCVSACSRLFLGGSTRLFSDDFPASLTYVGFHGHYDFGELNAAAVERNNLVAWTIKFTDGKVDRKLVERWAAIPTRNGDVRFYPRADPAAGVPRAVLCRGNESVKPYACEAINTDALAQGIVTSAARYRSPDADRLFYGERERAYPTASLQNLSDSEQKAAGRDLAAFRRAPLPRAFAVSTDGRVRVWRANSMKSAEEALRACSIRAASACKLHAIDDRFAP